MPKTLPISEKHQTSNAIVKTATNCTPLQATQATALKLKQEWLLHDRVTARQAKAVHCVMYMHAAVNSRPCACIGRRSKYGWHTTFRIGPIFETGICVGTVLNSWTCNQGKCLSTSCFHTQYYGKGSRLVEWFKIRRFSIGYVDALWSNTLWVLLKVESSTHTEAKAQAHFHS